MEGGSSGEDFVDNLFLWREVKGRRAIWIAMGVDDFIMPVANEDHVNHTQNFSPTSPTILHVDHLIKQQQYNQFEGV
jgi:bisphosphoglycerate-independent phosphoglycerate mutase (AlkP superfamily)